MIQHPDYCPRCEVNLSYTVDGKEYSHRIGHVVNDRVQRWECPQCGHQWDRKED